MAFEEGKTEMSGPRRTRDTLGENKPGNEARLVALVGPEAGRMFHITQDIVIGRDQAAGVRVADKRVSRQHARIRKCGPGHFEIEDLGSRNGTFVNGQKIFKQRLEFGEHIVVGDRAVFLFTYHNELVDHVNELQRMESIGRLAGGIAHDFNNLLACFAVNVDYVLGTGAKDVEAVVDCMKDMQTAIASGKSLTRQLLGFAQHGKYEERSIVVTRVLDDVLRLLKRTTPRSIEVVVDCDPHLAVVGDYSQIHQVIMNLAINAIEAMDGEGILTFTSQARTVDELDTQHSSPPLEGGEYVAVNVTDNGPGLDAETLSRVFEPFFSTKGRDRGGGLGLSTVFGIVKHHGGHIAAKSTPGQGATFEFLLPRAEVEEVFPSNDEDQTERIAIRDRENKGLLLLADDEPQVRRGCKRLLTSLGYEVLTGENGEDAVRLFQEHRDRVRLVLLDLIMPKMGGERAYEAISQIDPDVKVLLLSGYSDEETVRKALARGAVGFLEKPFSFEALRNAIGEALHPSDHGTAVANR